MIGVALVSMLAAADPWGVVGNAETTTLGRGKRAVQAYVAAEGADVELEATGPASLRLQVFAASPPSTLEVTMVRSGRWRSRNELRLKVQADLPKGSNATAALLLKVPAGAQRYRVRLGRAGALVVEAAAAKRPGSPPAVAAAAEEDLGAAAAEPEAGSPQPESAATPPVTALTAAPAPAASPAAPAPAASPATAGPSAGAAAFVAGGGAPAPRGRALDPGEGTLSVALMGLQDGGVGAQTVASLAAVVADTLSRTGAFRVITAEDIQAMLNLEASRQATSCGDDSCLVEIGAALGVSLLCSGSVSEVEGTTVVALQLLDPEGGKVVSRDSAQVTERATLLDAVRDTTRRLVRPVLEGRLGYLALRANEADANVYVDDALEGVTPAAQLRLPVGRHTVKVDKEGFIPYRGEVLIVRDQAVAVDAVLIPNPELVAAYELRANLMRWGAYSGFVVAAVMIGAGAYCFFDARERSTGLGRDIEAFNAAPFDNAEAGRLRAQSAGLNQTYVLGQGLAIGGVAAAAAAIVLLLVGDDPDRYDGFVAAGAAAGAR